MSQCVRCELKDSFLRWLHVVFSQHSNSALWCVSTQTGGVFPQCSCTRDTFVRCVLHCPAVLQVLAVTGSRLCPSLGWCG